MKYPLSFFCYSSLMVMVLSTLPVSAQIAPDGSLPTSVTSGDGLNFTIDNGTLSGGNLFHSFRDFSVPTNGSAFFNNAADVQNIFSRVTGGNISNIDGLLRANGGANLFLLNPAGIVFGPNASLNLGGSFFGTTAESIRFADGVEFSAANPTEPPLLTINVPVGLQMGTNPGGITVQGSGHKIASLGLSRPLNFNATPVGLQVAQGNTLALVGGRVSLEGGILTALGGRIELGAVESTTPAQIGLNRSATGWTMDYGNASQFGDVTLSRQALVNASGSGSGAIQVQGRTLRVSDGSALTLVNQGSQAAGGITLRTSDSIEFIGTTPDGKLGSFFLSDAMGTGDGGDVTISTGRYSIQTAGLSTARTLTAARGGNITLNAESLMLKRPVGSISQGIFTSTVGSATGQGGNLTIETQRLQHEFGALNASTQSLGSGGNLTINANAIELIGVPSNLPGNTNIGASSEGVGPAGNLTINTAQLAVRNGAFVSSSAYSEGNGGSVTVNATESIEVTGSRQDPIVGFRPSLITSSGILLPQNIRPILGFPDRVTGAAGGVIINTPRLVVSDGGEVSVRHDSEGNAGSLQINADTIALDSNGRLSAATASGKGGNINLQTDLLTLRRGSTITATASGTGDGGNITIDSPIILGLENSDIIANAVQGNGGNIQITTQGIFGLENRPQITDESDITASSQFGVSGNITITNPEVDPSDSLVNFSQEPIDPAQQVIAGCQWTAESEFVATGRSGVPANPNRPLASSRSWSDVRDLWEFRGETVEEASVPTDTPKQLVEATGWVVREDGTVELVATALRPQSGSFAASDCDPFRHSEAAH